MKNKKSYFFVLDAALGLFVLVIGVLLIASFYLAVPQPAQVSLLSDDLMNFLSNTKIKDLNNPYAGIGGELWKQGEINDPEISLLQQIGEFYAESKPDIAEKFIQNASAASVPAQFEYEVWMDNVLLYPRSPSAEHLSSKSKTHLILTSKKINFGIMNRTTSSLWGPYKAEVFVWER